MATLSNEVETVEVGLPDDLKPQQFIEKSDHRKPEKYREEIERALRYYRGLAKHDTRQALRRSFPETYRFMVPVSMKILTYVIHKQATVFSGTPRLNLLDKTGHAVEKAGDKSWQDVLTEAEAPRHLQEINRLTRLCKRSFGRCTWDVDRE